MNKYTKIVPFDVGTERPTEEYTELLKAQNAAMLEALENIVHLVDIKGGESSTFSEVAYKGIATKAIRKANQ